MNEIEEVNKAILSFIEESSEKPKEKKKPIEDIIKLLEKERKDFGFSEMPETHLDLPEEKPKKKVEEEPELREENREPNFASQNDESSEWIDKYSKGFSEMYDRVMHISYDSMRNEANEPVYSQRMPTLRDTRKTGYSSKTYS